MRNLYSHRYRTPEGLLVYVPTDEGCEAGEAVVRRVLGRWRPPSYFFHFKRGGHVAAARHHLGGTCFARLDIRAFFDSVTRSKLHRALKRLRFSHDEAWDIAAASTVRKSPGDGLSLPFGFVQSSALASVALDQSALGACFRTSRRSGVSLSVYVDDILASARDESALWAYVEALSAAASSAGYELNGGKSQITVPSVEAFNLALSRGDLRVMPERMEQFGAVERTPEQVREAAIVGYVETVNPVQAAALKALYAL